MALIEVEAEIRAILSAWGPPKNAPQAYAVAGLPIDAERPLVAFQRGLWLICASDPWRRETHAGCRDDGVALARDIVRAAKQMKAGVWKPPGGNPLSMGAQEGPFLQTPEAEPDLPPMADENARYKQTGPFSFELDPIDAEFSSEESDLGAELLDTYATAGALEGPEAPEPDLGAPPQDRFMGLDDLDRRRNLRIGDVTVKAAALMPLVDVPRLAELRNFAMGVSEGRWSDDPALQEELGQVEAVARYAHAIAASRDAKVAYLLSAPREDVEAFNVEADWP